MMDDKFAHEITVIILAGGRGTRIAALNPDKPKPMVTVADEPFLAWVIKRLTREGFTNIVLSIGYMADVIIAWLNSRTFAQEKIRAHREQRPLGTGGAIADVLPFITTEYVLILNGDTLLLADFLPLLRKLEDKKLHGVILARFLEDTSRYGRLVVEDGLLTAFQEKKFGQGLINAGVYAFRTDWLREHINLGLSSMELDVFPQLLKQSARIGIELTTAPFIDIGTPETLMEANSFIEAHHESFAL